MGANELSLPLIQFCQRMRQVKGRILAQDFPFLSEEEVADAQAADKALESISSSSSPITFDWVREKFKRDNGLKDQLEYGTAVLSSPDHLNQYLYTYGPMIQSQWNTVLKSCHATNEPLRIIDYGAGQGLAGLLVADAMGEQFAERVTHITVIEPSTSAIVRCHSVYNKLFPNAEIICLNLMLDDLESEFFAPSEVRTLHIFSNILDIPSFNQGALFDKSFTNGQHTIVAVSHDRNFAGGSTRIRAIEEEIRSHKHAGWLTVTVSTISEFTCGNGGKFDAISWIAELTVDR